MHDDCTRPESSLSCFRSAAPVNSSLMHLAETPEEQRAWMNQWRAAAIALRQMKREELRAMTDEDAVAAFNALDMPPELVWRCPERIDSSGLVEQQRIFQKIRAH
jgi:hypothetical protein